MKLSDKGLRALDEQLGELIVMESDAPMVVKPTLRALIVLTRSLIEEHHDTAEREYQERMGENL